jgi:hypothetical protein
MTYLYSTQKVTADLARLNTGADGSPPFAVVELNELAYLTFATPEEAYALRDACQQAGDMLAEAEGTAP